MGELGLFYAWGKGVPPNAGYALYWLNRAVQAGDEDYRKYADDKRKYGAKEQTPPPFTFADLEDDGAQSTQQQKQPPKRQEAPNQQDSFFDDYEDEYEDEDDPFSLRHMSKMASEGARRDADIAWARHHPEDDAIPYNNDQAKGKAAFDQAEKYRWGRGVSKDLERAKKYYLEAITNSYVPAIYEYGLALAGGILGDKDPTRAAIYFQMAADREDYKAMNELGYAYEKGNGVTQNDRYALYWYNEAGLRHTRAGMDARKRLRARGIKEQKPPALRLGALFDDPARNKNAKQQQAQKPTNNSQPRKQAPTQNKQQPKKEISGVAHLIIGKSLLQEAAFTFDAEKRKKMYAEALDNFEKAYAKGEIEAAFHLGNMYGHQDYGMVNYIKGFDWHKKAAEGGYPESQYIVGAYYENGVGTDADWDKAFFWYTKAQKSGYYKADEALEKLNAKKSGQFSEQDKKLAKNHYDLGVGLFKFGEIEKGIQHLKIASDYGHAEAALQLAILYEEGEHVAQDYKKALSYYTLAADRGDVDAQSVLGLKYEIGHGAVPKNLEKAVHYLQLAARQGDENAQSSLRKMGKSW